MSFIPDITPIIPGPSTHIPDSPNPLKYDIKPSLSDLARITTSRDFRKEREALKKQYDLEKRNLDLEEENRLLREARPAVKPEPGAGEVKPDITRLDGGSRLAPIDLNLVEGSDDEDDIVFVREVKGGGAKTRISGMSHSHPERLSTGSLIGQIPRNPQVKAETSPFESTITLNLEENISSTPKLAERQSESRPSFNAEQPDRASTSIPRHRSPSIDRGKIHRKRSSAASHGSSGTESSDSSDDTYTGRSPTPVWGGPRKKPKKATRHCRVVIGQRDYSRVRSGSDRQSRNPHSPRTAETDLTSISSGDGKEDVDDSSGGDDEYTGPYKGPHLHVISVEWINDRLDRSFSKYSMTDEHLGQWAAWWPRTIVAKHHRLDSAGIWLLTMAVHKWWSDLLDELNSPDVEWPEGLDEAGQEDITMKVEEITLSKESAMVAAKRMVLKDGEAIPADSVLRLRHGRRKTSEP
jgi:hypothetical protein